MAKSDASRNVDAMFEPVKTADVDDLALLPRRFDLFASEVRQELASLRTSLLPVLARLEDALSDLKHHQSELERRLCVLEGAP